MDPRSNQRQQKDPDEHNSNPTSSSVFSPVAFERAQDTGNDEMTATHDDGTGDQERLSSELINPQHGWNGGQEHDNTNDTRGKQGSGVTRQPQGGKDEWGIVQDEVDTGPLLEHHGQTGNGDPLECRFMGDHGLVLVEIDLELGLE